MRVRVPIACTILIAINVSLGDMPLPPPGRIVTTSPNGQIRAVSDPNEGTSVEDPTRNEVLWHIPSWHRSMFVANDGKHLITEYDGMNLIPINFTDDLVLLTFWREGKKIREITVKDLFPDHSKLLRTVSHYVWRTTIKFDGQGRLNVSRIDGKMLIFDVPTGQERNG
jgi:hypothetical protein